MNHEPKKPDLMAPAVKAYGTAILKLIFMLAVVAALVIIFVACGKTKFRLPAGAKDCVFRETDGEGAQRWTCKMLPGECSVYVNSGKFRTTLNCTGG